MDFTSDNYFFVRVSDICSVFDNTREDKNGEHADTTPKSKEPKVREQGVNPVRKNRCVFVAVYHGWKDESTRNNTLCVAQ